MKEVIRSLIGHATWQHDRIMQYNKKLKKYILKA